jgi:ATP-binding cassette subfamily B protein
VLLISHRFSTVRLADRIVVLAHGRLIEEGTHSELMARSGTYARMWQAQTRRADG